MTESAGLVNVLRVLATIVFAVALPIFLVTGSVRTVALSQSFYMREFARYRSGEAAGLPDAELPRVADAFIDYFQGPLGRFDLRVNARQGNVQLLNEREIRHMVDVQALVQRVLQATWIALAALIISGVALVAVDVSAAVPSLLRALAIGGFATVGVVGLVALASLVDFYRIFLLFHFMSFSNDLWLLDPRTDRLIQLFPEGFFYDAALQIGLRSVAIGGAMGVVALIGQRVLR